MTLQEKIQKIESGYLSGSVHRNFCLTIHDAINIIRKQSEMLKVAKEALRDLSYLGNGNTLGNSDGNMIARKALATIEEMESK